MTINEEFIKKIDEEFGDSVNSQIKVAVFTLKEIAKIKDRLNKLEATNK